MQVPEGWEVKKLEEIAKVERGKFSARPRNDPKFFGGDIPFVQTGDIAAASTYLENYSQTLNEKGLEVSRAFPKNTILITIAANIGDTAITTFEVACPDSLVAITPSHETNVYWLNIFMETQKNKLIDLAPQNAQRNINLQVLKPLLILTPPLNEQTKIAEILSTWDNAITTTEQLLANSQQQKKALMQQLLTGKKRLLDDNGQRFSGEWEATLLKEISKIAKGKALSSRNLVEGNYPVIAGGKTSPYNHNAFTHENIITVSASGAYAGFVAYHRDKIWASDCSVISNIESSDIGFIFYWLSYNQNRVYSLQSGGAQPHVYPRDLAGLKVLHPPLKEQQKIAAVLAAADDEIRVLEQKLDHLKQEKKALMQQLLTGKRRVQT